MGEPLPLILRFGIRLGKFVAGWFLIGLAGALARHLGMADLTRASYEGGLDMLLILWFMDLLGKDRSGDEGR